MERAMRVVSVERGHDPRDYVLVAFGGAGGMHACEIAQQLEIATIVVPRYAGVLSALGLLLADVTKDYSTSILRPSVAISTAELERRFKPLVAEARRALGAEGFGPRRQVIEQLVDVRYVGQSYEITLPISRHYRGEFDRRHAQAYGYSNPARPTEIVNVRVKALGVTVKPALPRRSVRPTRPKAGSVRQSRFDGRIVPTAFYRWDGLAPGAHASGPAVVTGAEATVVIPPAFAFRADGFGNVIIQRK
jgi:N-methylhydantoinase A/oxoprolinase/acetone carboxylase beta subunit